MSFWKRIKRYRRDCFNEVTVAPEPAAPSEALIRESKLKGTPIIFKDPTPVTKYKDLDRADEITEKVKKKMAEIADLPPIQLDGTALSIFSSSGPGRLDPQSPTWIFIHHWAKEALEKARANNDSLNCDPAKTSALRGEIKILKTLIALPNPKKGLLIEE